MIRLILAALMIVSFSIESAQAAVGPKPFPCNNSQSRNVKGSPSLYQNPVLAKHAALFKRLDLFKKGKRPAPYGRDANI